MAFSLRLHRDFRAQRRDTRAKSGSAAVEFAIVGPVLLLVLSGIFAYGGYFLTAHTVQQIANDAARAALAGLDDQERLALARDATQQSFAQQRFMRGDVADVDLERSDSTITVRVTYDASEDLYWSFQALLPTPRPEISRAASIRLGGL